MSLATLATRLKKEKLKKQAIAPKPRGAILPFYPNPGSQSELFFDILGYEKINPVSLNTDESLYPDWLNNEYRTHVKNGDRAFDTVYEVVPVSRNHKIDFINYRAGNGCIDGDTLIDTEYGQIPIKNLTDRSVRVKTMMGLLPAHPSFIKGVAPLYRVKMESGKEILVTANHRFLSPTGWNQLRFLRAGDIVACCDNYHEKYYQEKTKGFWDGCLPDFRRDDVQLPPVQVFFQDKLRQLYKQSECQHIYGVACCSDHRQPHFSASSLPFSLVAIELQSQKPHIFWTNQLLKLPLDKDQQFHLQEDRDIVLLPLVAQHQELWGFFLERALQNLDYSPVLAQQPFCFQDAYRLQQFFDIEPSLQGLSSVLVGVHQGQLFRAQPGCFSPVYRESETFEKHHSCFARYAYNKQQDLLHEYLSQQKPSYSELLQHNSNDNGAVLCCDYWSKIKSIEYVKTDRYYDIHVPIANHYLAHGIWHHNTGKSSIGAYFVYSRSLLAPKTRGLITANSYPQLMDSTLVVLAEFCIKHNIELQLERNSGRVSLLDKSPEDAAKLIALAKRCLVNGKFYYVRSADSFQGGTAKAKQTGRGTTLTEIWADEILKLPDESVINTLLTRLRGKAGVKPIGLITSTLNTDKSIGGWDDLLFNDPSRNPETKERFIELGGVTHENRHNLDPDYIPRLKSALTDELYLLEVLGQRISITEGKIFKYFKRSQHTLSLEYDSNYPIHLSLDFNHDPMTCVMGQFVNGELLIIKEFFLRNSDSFNMGDTLSEYLLGLSPDSVYLHGDATGSQKTANSKNSNWQIINAKLKRFKPIRKYGKVNPSVQDSINAVNCAFHQDKLFIDNSCKELMKDLESLKYNSNNEIDKKTDAMRSHLADCLRYLVNDLMPYSRSPQWSSGKYSY